MKLAVGVVLCMQDQYGVFPPLAAIIAARRRDMLGTRHCRRSTRISAHVSSRAELNKILGRAVHTGDYTAQFIPNMLYGVAVWRSCRLLHLGDVALLKEIKDSLSIMRCVVTVLVAVIIPEMLPGKWHLGVSQNAPVQLCRHLSGTTRGDLKSSLDVYRTTTSLDPISLTPLLEALTSKTYSKPAIYQVKLEYWLVTEESMMPTGHCQVLPPLHPLQAETANPRWQSTGAFLWAYRHGNHGTKTRCFPDRPHSIQILHRRRQSPSTYEAILSGHPQQSMILTRCGLPRSPGGLAWHQSSSGSMPPEDVVDRSTSQTHATSNNTLLHALTGKCHDFMPDT